MSGTSSSAERDDRRPIEVVIVGGGFAGIACAHRLATEPRAHVTLIDRSGYHQFQPLLYQVATAELAASDIRFDLAAMFERHANVDVRTARGGVDRPRRPVVTPGRRHDRRGGRAGRSAPAPSPTSSTPRARRSTRSRSTASTTPNASGCGCCELFQDAAAEPELSRRRHADLRDRRRRSDRGGDGGRRGRAGPQRDAARLSATSPSPAQGDPGRPRPYRAGAPSPTRPTPTRRSSCNAAGSSCASASRSRRWSRDRLTLGDGTTIKTRLVVWGGGEMAAPLAFQSGLGQGRGGRIDVAARPDRGGLPRGVRAGRRREHSRRATARRCRSWAASRSRRATGRAATSSPTWRAAAGSRSTTRTRESWR